MSKLRLKPGLTLWVGLDHEDDGWIVRPHIQKVEDGDQIDGSQCLVELETLARFEVEVQFAPGVLIGELWRDSGFDRTELFRRFADHVTEWVDDPENGVHSTINYFFVRYSKLTFEKCDDGFGGPRRLKITWLSGTGNRVLARVYVPFRAVDEYFIDAD